LSIRAQVRHALDLEVGVPRRAGFRAPAGPNLVSLFKNAREAILHVRRPMKPGAVSQYCSIDFATGRGGKPLDPSPYCVVGRLARRLCSACP